MVKLPAFKILIAEDDRDMCEIYEEAVASLSERAQIRTVHDGSQAANLLRTEKFNVAILDVKLPTVNGLQVGQIARESEINKSTPLIIASGSLNEESQKRAISLGKVQVLPKPIEMELLKKAIVSAVTSGAGAGFDAKGIELIHTSFITAIKAVPPLAMVKVEKASVVEMNGQTLSGMTTLCIAVANTLRATLRMHIDPVILESLKHHVQPKDTLISSLVELIHGVLLAWNQELATKANALGRRMSINVLEFVTGTDYTLQNHDLQRTLLLPFTLGEGRITLQLTLGAATPKKSEANSSAPSGDLIIN
jgi:DNA-binding response OmpR family regulator